MPAVLPAGPGRMHHHHELHVVGLLVLSPARRRVHSVVGAGGRFSTAVPSLYSLRVPRVVGMNALRAARGGHAWTNVTRTRGCRRWPPVSTRASPSTGWRRSSGSGPGPPRGPGAADRRRNRRRGAATTETVQSAARDRAHPRRRPPRPADDEPVSDRYRSYTPSEPAEIRRKLLFGVALLLAMASVYAGLLGWGPRAAVRPGRPGGADGADRADQRRDRTAALRPTRRAARRRARRA